MEQAARLAAAAGHALHVVHVLDTTVVEDLAEALQKDASELYQSVLADARERLSESVSRVKTPATVTSEALAGHIADEVLKFSSHRGVRLLCLGVRQEEQSEGSGKLMKLCLRHVNVPVLLVRERHHDNFKTVVVGIDFSPTSRDAFREAVKLARAEKSRVVAVHAFYPPWTRLHYRAPTNEAEPRFMKQYTDVLHFRLRNFTKESVPDLSDIDVHWELEKTSSHGDGLIEAATRNHADLIVVGTQGRASLRVRFLGSTAEKVLRNARCSVLAIPPAAQ